MATKPIKNMAELEKDLCLDRAEFKDGNFDHVSMKEKSNNAGKIINTVRARLEYAKLRKESPNIDFMKCH